MFVSVESGESGWSLYVYGNEENRREGATLIKGDLFLGDTICESTDYKSGQYFRIVLSFHQEENVSPEKGREIVQEFMQLILYGYREDEYHLDIVEHTDTDELHYHIRVPKLNMLTGTQLHYHYLSDIKRKDAIHRYLEIKHDLISPFEKRKLIPNPTRRVNQINQWREEHNQKPFNLSNKKGRGEAEERISDYVQEMVMSGFLTTLEEVQAELASMNFAIAKVGHDNGKDFDYITIENDTGKIRLKGDIYGKRFYRHNEEDRTEAIRSGKSIERRESNDRGSLEQAKSELDKANQVRSEFIGKRFKTARERALSSQQTPTSSNSRSSGDRSKDRKEQRGKTDFKSVRNRRRRLHREDEKQDKRRVKDDRIRREAVERIGKLRERTRDRAEEIERVITRVRIQHQDIIERFDREISTELNRVNAAREHRRGEFTHVLKNAYTAKPQDYQSIATTQRSRTAQRATRRGFEKIVQWFADNLQQFKRKVDERSDGIVKRVRGYIKDKATQEIERFKTVINLAEFATSFGYKKDNEKSESNAPVLSNDSGDYIIIGRNSKDSHYLYINPQKDKDSGSIIDFVKNHTHETMEIITHRLKAWIKNPKPQENITVMSAIKDVIEISSIWNKIDVNDVCLARYWGFGNLSMLSKYPNVKYGKDGYFYFKTQDTHGICGVEQWNQNERCLVEGSSRGVFTTGNLCEAESIIIFKNPIEMFSYKELGIPLYNIATVSIMESIDLNIEKSIEDIIKNNLKAKIILAVADDQEGNFIVSKIKEISNTVNGNLDGIIENRPEIKGQSWHDKFIEKRGKGQPNKISGIRLG